MSVKGRLKLFRKVCILYICIIRNQSSSAIKSVYPCNPCNPCGIVHPSPKLCRRQHFAANLPSQCLSFFGRWNFKRAWLFGTTCSTSTTTLSCLCCHHAHHFHFCSNITTNIISPLVCWNYIACLLLLQHGRSLQS